MTNETSAPAQRREVSINGQRVKVIDVHAHCSIPEATALAGVSSGWPALHFENADRRLADMDIQGIDVEALSINPFWYAFERDLAEQVVRIQNERLAEFCASPRPLCRFGHRRPPTPGTGRRTTRRGCHAHDLRGTPSVAASKVLSYPTRSSNPSGRRPKNWAAWYSSTRRAPPSWRAACGAMACWKTCRQPARDHARPLAPDLRRHARSPSRASRLSPPTEAAISLPTLPAPMPGRRPSRSAYADRQTRDRIPSAALLRFPGLHG